MRKAFFAVMLIFVMASCSHPDGVGMQFDADPDVSIDQTGFASLDVLDKGSLSPDSISTRITVDDDRFMNVYLQFYNDFELAFECDGSELLDQETFDVIRNLAGEADLLELKSELDDACLGVQATTVSYAAADGRSNEFSFFRCSGYENAALEAVDDLVDYLEQLAEEEIEGCNRASYLFPN